MSKRKTSRKKLPHSTSTSSKLAFSRYEITYDPIGDACNPLPEELQDAIERLHSLAQKRPRQAIPELESLLRDYPHVPQIYNYLSVAYSVSGQHEKMKSITAECYRRHPDYLFARLNYAEVFLMEYDLDKIPSLFDNKFDLQLLYPKRTRFHISEVVGFMSVIGRYFHARGEYTIADNFYNVLQQIAPNDKRTKQLKMIMQLNFLQRLMRYAKGKIDATTK